MTRIAAVTGAAGGIGRAVVETLRADGWRVIGIDRREPDNSLAIDEFHLADLALPDAASMVVQALNVASLDALVNNAAVQVNAAIVDTTDDQWDEVMQTNLRIAFQLTRDLHPALLAARGSIVNVSSVHAVATSENVAAYAVSKGALTTLTRSTALEFAADGIRVNAVLPGAIDTEMLRDGLSRRPHPDGADGNLRAIEARTPLGFVAGPEPIARAIVDLADGDRSPYTTGQCLVIDGGATLRLGTE